jgi:hypothetical protein
VKRTLEKMKPNRGNFAAKLIYKSKSLPYQIIDHKEVWISGKKETESGLPCVLWTNGSRDPLTKSIAFAIARCNVSGATGRTPFWINSIPANAEISSVKRKAAITRRFFFKASPLNNNTLSCRLFFVEKAVLVS